MTPSSVARLVGATMGETARRWASWRGGSMAMNMGSGKSARWSRMEMPPRVEREEKVAWLMSTAMMSLYLVTDQ
jgi:hypothetical protein